MSEQPRGLTASAGWAVVHLFYRIYRRRWQKLPAAERAAAVDAFAAWLERSLGEEGLQLFPFVGVTKCAVGFVAVHPDLWRVQQLTQEIAASTLGAYLTPVASFLSLTEASEYITNEVDWVRLLIAEQKLDPAAPEFGARLAALRQRMAMYAESRIHPQLPDNYPILCFYPMAKSRREPNNWYRLSFEERKQHMIAHGEAGRRFADRVTQLNHHVHWYR